jgi:hypothetical protein
MRQLDDSQRYVLLCERLHKRMLEKGWAVEYPPATCASPRPGVDPWQRPELQQLAQSVVRASEVDVRAEQQLAHVYSTETRRALNGSACAR